MEECETHGCPDPATRTVSISGGRKVVHARYCEHHAYICWKLGDAVSPRFEPAAVIPINSAERSPKMTEVVNLETQTFLEHRLNALRLSSGLPHHAHENWPVESEPVLDSVASLRGDGRYEALIKRQAGAAMVRVHGGTAYVSTFGASEAAARELLNELREQIPRAQDANPDLVPITFWSLSPIGPQSFRRMIDAPDFDRIEGNYPNAAELLSLLHDWTPGTGGQLLLWHGEAGTGKTTALRSLGREWRSWADLHYIVDPDKFFGDSASYMLQVMMGDSEPVLLLSSDPGEAPAPEPRWRVLVLEDCGELLTPDAHREVGQALSRLLNTCDGLIGRGLRLLILITTNEPLEKVHPAISRPGRCASRIEFDRFSAEQSEGWLGYPVGGPREQLTLADLYAIREGYRSEQRRRQVGFAA